MNKYKTILEEVLTAGITLGILTFSLNYLTISYWQRDGFDFLEIALMTVIAGLFLFTLIIPVNIFFLNRGIRNSIKSESATIKRIFQVLISLSIALIVFLIIDTISFLVDDSIPKDYAIMLNSMAERNGDELPGIEDFSNLPFGIQNAILTFVLGLLGTLISLIFIKTDGELFKTKNDWN